MIFLPHRTLDNQFFIEKGIAHLSYRSYFRRWMVLICQEWPGSCGSLRGWVVLSYTGSHTSSDFRRRRITSEPKLDTIVECELVSLAHSLC